MNRLVLALAASLFALGLSSPALAGAQQEKMKTCNAEAKTKELKGEERKSFMKECLSAKSAEAPAAAATPQQQKMKGCNADAASKGLKGDERKKFMSDCLKA